jgi:hypothetical protein
VADRLFQLASISVCMAPVNPPPHAYTLYELLFLFFLLLFDYRPIFLKAIGDLTIQPN